MPVPSDIALSQTIVYGPAGYKGFIQNKFIFMQACFASIGGLLYGYDQGVISGVLVMSNFEKTFPSIANNATLRGWMVSILTLGAMFGALINGPIADLFSRRWSILYANLLFLAGSAIQAGSINTPMIFVSRFITGVAIGMLTMVIPLYLSEVAPPNIRGSLAIATNWLTNFIICLVAPRMLSSIFFKTFYFFLAFCVILFVWVLFFVPETRGIPIEHMDRIFGGTQGQRDLERIAHIRARLDVSHVDEKRVSLEEEKMTADCSDVKHIE